MAALQKNIASQNVTFCMINASTGAADASATVSVFVVKDNGAQASGGGTVTNCGNGQYNYAPTQAETNATDVGFLFTATGDIPLNIDFHTDQVDGNGFLKVDLVDIAGSAVSTSSAQLGVNAVNIAGQAAQIDANNLLKVDVEDVNGSAVIETGYSLAQAMRLMFSALCAKCSGLSGTTATFRDVNDTTNRIVATVDSSGDRTAVTLTP